MVTHDDHQHVCRKPLGVAASMATNKYNAHMANMKIIALLIGVLRVAPHAAAIGQSEVFLPKEEPIAIQENDEGQRRVATPEVVLQLKYDKGALNKIYLAQFRQESSAWKPSVTTRTNLCADLCHAGLGGEACGSSCTQMLPVGLQTALQETNHTDAIYGQPRFSVCPALCGNYLGEPLCNCEVEQEEEKHDVDWPAICSAFCVDGYALGGCPSCSTPQAADSVESGQLSRVLNTSEGWHAWCNVQCRQGQGGAACNCDRTPFSA